MSENKQIYLAPACHEVDREWCQDDVWGTCDDCGEQSVRYVLASDHDKRVAELEAEIKRLTGFVVQRRKMCDDYDKALEEVASQMHAFKAELALSVGLLRRYHELLSTIAMHRATAPKDWGDHFKAEFDRRIAELSTFLSRHGDKS